MKYLKIAIIILVINLMTLLTFHQMNGATKEIPPYQINKIRDQEELFKLKNQVMQVY